MGYAEAIEEQMGLLSLWQRRGKESLREEFNSKTDEAAEGLAKHITLTLATAAPLYVEPGICRLLEHGRDTFPDATLVPEQCIEPCGFVYFASPLVMPMMSDAAKAAVGAECGPLRAIAWRQLTWDSPKPPHGKVPGVLALWFHADYAPHDYLSTMRAFSLWPFGDTVQGWGHVTVAGAREHIEPQTLAQNTYLVQLLEFVRQRVLTLSSRPLLNRAARRRAQRVFSHEPMVRIVEVRRREYQQHDESHPRDVEYTCQWLVRGHWRQHYFPASGEHKPLWIQPHIKGPGDKPLKVPRATAYEVVR